MLNRPAAIRRHSIQSASKHPKRELAHLTGLLKMILLQRSGLCHGSPAHSSESLMSLIQVLLFCFKCNPRIASFESVWAVLAASLMEIEIAGGRIQPAEAVGCSTGRGAGHARWGAGQVAVEYPAIHLPCPRRALPGNRRMAPAAARDGLNLTSSYSPSVPKAFPPRSNGCFPVPTSCFSSSRPSHGRPAAARDGLNLTSLYSPSVPEAFPGR